MKKNIYVDFEVILELYRYIMFNNKEKITLEPIIKFLERLNKNYSVYIYTLQDREAVYKWLIRQNLDAYINDVKATREPNCIYINKYRSYYTKVLLKTGVI